MVRTNFNFPNQTRFHRGKVRDTYTVGDLFISVATDSISAFDVVLPCAIPYKGQVLNQLSAYFFNKTNDICPNWKLSTPDPNVTVGILCRPFAIEMIVRGYLTGSAWRAYKKGVREICGVQLPEGMCEDQRFPKPIVTPTTKAPQGEHDQDISKEEILSTGLATSEEYDILEKYSLSLFQRCSEISAKRGLILVDTKYEFGKKDEKIFLIDEINTPDSSRFWYEDDYEDKFKRGEPQKQLSKEFIRKWLMDNNLEGKSIVDIPNEIIEETSNRYIEIFETITGETFISADNTTQMNRVENSILKFLRER